MPEEKKEKFTFSDKIKNSKPAGNKSFAKSSSKIGRDGKPKATLFERTRRDAPFFIAALVALLLLPFLYKYSGQASEEQLLTPGNEQTDFDPERYGFDTAMIEDPDGQIAQLAGRDSLSLIKGWGSNQEEDYGRDDMDLDASAAYDSSAQGEGEYSAEKHSSSEMDVEDNTTNIYKRRAGRATRAAFRRTKVGTLNPAGIRRPGGSRLGINNWGGGLKGAAKKVGPSAPASAPKPVSLQPLRAAGSRSGFGQGGAAAARKSKDNMGKADAREALRDSYVKPVGPTRTGGLDLFSMGPGGGSGKLGRTINITPGKEPWWWDMMRTRMQKEWEKQFERKWKWIDWMDDLARNILGGILNCLITGEDDGSMGSFFGHAAGGGKVAKCGDLTEEEWNNCKPCMEIGKFGKHTCNMYLGNFNEKSSAAKKGWQPGSSSGGGAQGFIGVRLGCLGIGGGGYGGNGVLDEGCTNCLNCENMPELYQLNTATLPRKWQKHTYIYVVARNYFPETLKKRLGMTAPRNLLCTQDHVTIGGNNSSGAGANSIKEERASTEQEVSPEIIAQMKMTGKKQTERQGQLQDIYTADPESVIHGCVIYVQQGDTFNYENFKNSMVLRFAELASGKQNLTVDYLKDHADINKLAHDAFLQLDLMFVESFASQNKLAYAKLFERGNRLDGVLPMMYWRFYDAYVRHKKTTHKATGTRTNVDNRKLRKIGADTAIGPKCYFDNLNIECGPDNTRTAKVKFSSVSFKGGDPTKKPSTNDIVVGAQFRDANGTKGLEQPMINPDKSADNGYTFTYTFSKLLSTNTFVTTNKVSDANQYENAGLVGMIRWTVKRGEQIITKDCPLNLSGDSVTPPGQDKGCDSPQESKECCDKLMGDKPHEWVEGNAEGSQCVDKRQVPPVTGKIPRLAPVLSWVPNSGKADCRGDVAEDKNPGQSDFSSCDKIDEISQNPKNTQHCGSQTPIMMDSEAAAQFVRNVVKAYNAANPNAPRKLSDKFYGNLYPTDGEFVDALFIAAKNSSVKDMPKTVPASAVCELGRDFFRMSRDKHTKEMLVANPMGTPYPQDNSPKNKDKNNVFHNELGSFLVYIHDQAIFYPQKYMGSSSQKDYRFIVVEEENPLVNWSKQECIYQGGIRCKEYHHTNYNYINNSHLAYNTYMNGYKGQGGIEQTVFKQTGGEYPLSKLVQGKRFPEASASAPGGKGPSDKYIAAITGLIREKDGFQPWQGSACTDYYNGGTGPELKVSDVIKYVQAACEIGLDFKPIGSPGSAAKNKPVTGGPTKNVGGQPSQS